VTPAGVILAGGRSLRMGTAKALVALQGVALLDRVLARVAPQVAELAISTNVALSAPFPQLTDPIGGFQGPLAGVLAALEWTAQRGHDLVATFPCDTPFLPLDVVARLSAARADIAVARSAGRVHPVCAVWSTHLATDLRAVLTDERGERSVMRFQQRYRVEVVDFAAPLADPFLNMNCRADVEAAERVLAA
jgi:molybdopterin-guanine dinucleotide biosynthesis protein A